MYPFEQAIKNGADSLLIGHLVVKDINIKVPASLSRKFITRYLRKKYRYNGLIITDDLKMKAIRFIYGTKKSVVKAFEAGNDIIVFRFSQDKQIEAIKEVVRLVKEGKLKESRINKSTKRIINIKQKYNISDFQEEGKLDIEQINKEIKDIRQKCEI